MTDTLLIVFCCVAVNHLGLVKAVETVTRCHELPIVSCPRCLSFWIVLLYGLITGGSIIGTIATAFMCAWLAPWLELAMGYTDTLFNKIYDTIYPGKDDTTATDDGTGNTDSVLPELRTGSGKRKGAKI